MKFILILWLAWSTEEGTAERDGSITTATFFDHQACMSALNHVRNAEGDRSRIRGVCVPTSTEKKLWPK